MYTISEFAAISGVSTHYLASLCTRGHIPGAKKANAVWLIPEDAEIPNIGIKERIRLFQYSLDTASFTALLHQDIPNTFDRFFITKIGEECREHDYNTEHISTALCDYLTPLDSEHYEIFCNQISGNCRNTCFVTMYPHEPVHPLIQIALCTSVLPKTIATEALARAAVKDILRFIPQNTLPDFQNYDRIYRYGFGISEKDRTYSYELNHKHPGL